MWSADDAIQGHNITHSPGLKSEGTSSKISCKDDLGSSTSTMPILGKKIMPGPYSNFGTEYKIPKKLVQATRSDPLLKEDGSDSTAGAIESQSDSDYDSAYDTDSWAQDKAALQHSRRDSSPPRKRLRPNKTSKVKALFDHGHEQEQSMLVGIEKYLAGTAGSSDEDSDKDENPWKAPQTKRKTKRKSRKQAGYLNDFGSLMTSNTLLDAANNRASSPLLNIDETEQEAALARLVEGLPNSDIRRQDKNQIRDSLRILGRNYKKIEPVPGSGQLWAVPGMASSLPHYQIQGAAFMKRREIETTAPFGGINADSMGLGKTVETIALMTCNRPKRSDKFKCTLIVASPALVDQWEKELEIHAPATFPDPVVHKAPYSLGDKQLKKLLQHSEVLLTTYHEVMRSYPNATKLRDAESPEEAVALWNKMWEKDRGILHRETFYRIVLDESQAIKNYKSQTSLACRALSAKYRWTLSGTPIANTVEEIYPYLRFLRVPGIGFHTDFLKDLCSYKKDKWANLKHIFDGIMIRRTIATKVLGRPILELPGFTQHLKNIAFCPVERVLYDILRRRFARYVNKASRNGILRKKRGLILAMYIVLRKCTGHLFQAQDILQEMLDAHCIRRLAKAVSMSSDTKEIGESDEEILTALHRLVDAKGESEDNLDQEAEDEEDVQGPKSLTSKLKQYLLELQSTGNVAQFEKSILCQFCKKPPKAPLVTSCRHIYCYECLDVMRLKASPQKASCSTCQTRFQKTEPCSILKQLRMKPPQSTMESKQKPRQIVMRWVCSDGKLIFSAKTLAVHEQIKQWLDQDSSCKIIVYSQFHMMMQILGQMCEINGWQYCHYNGGISHAQRAKVLADFKSADSSKQILIASLRCGSVGLNITEATRVICLDLWFNRSADDQAFCRIYRRGQDKQTSFARVVVKNTVDERLEQMQTAKQEIINGAIDDTTKLSKLPDMDMLKLFGDVGFDEETGKAIIIVETDDVLDFVVPPVAEGEEDPIIPLLGNFA